MVNEKKICKSFKEDEQEDIKKCCQEERQENQKSQIDQESILISLKIILDYYF